MNTPGLTWVGAACSVRACVSLNHGLYNLTGGPFRTPHSAHLTHHGHLAVSLPFRPTCPQAARLGPRAVSRLREAEFTMALRRARVGRVPPFRTEYDEFSYSDELTGLMSSRS